MPIMSFTALRRFAEEGVGEAQFRLACAFELGTLTDRDCTRALEWYAVAYSSGIAKCALSAADLYASLGDFKSAIAWYEKAATSGEFEAFWRLGVLHEEGRGVSVDLVKARELYSKACEKTKTHPRSSYSGEMLVPCCKQACWRLGRMFELGLGGAKDVDQARKYYALVLCEYSHDWVKGAEWAELYYRYAELIKGDGNPYDILKLYEGAARYNYPGADVAYVDYWLTHKNSEGDSIPHIGIGSDLLRKVAYAGNLEALRCLAPHDTRAAWKLFRCGEKQWLKTLIDFYAGSDKTVEGLKGRRLCAIVGKVAAGDRCVLTASPTKKEMLEAFKTATTEGEFCGEACFKIYKWGQNGLLTRGGMLWDGGRYECCWLSKSASLNYEPAVEEIERQTKEHTEAAFKDEVTKRLAGKTSGSYYLEKQLYPRLIDSFEGLANAGDAAACKVMADICWRGDYGLRKDEELYRKWLIAAARAGDVESARTACDLKIDRATVFELSMSLVQHGDHQAAFRCAEMLEKGDGCVKDLRAAAMLYEKYPENVIAQRQLYAIYSSGAVVPSRKEERLNELCLALIAGDEVDGRVAAKNVLYMIFNEGVPVERFAGNISKAVDKGEALTHFYAGGGYSGYGWGRKRYEPLFRYEPDLSWLPGKFTRLILCLYGRQLEAKRCKEYLCQVYSLFNSGDLRAYQKELREENYSHLFEHRVLRRLDARLYSTGALTGEDVESALLDDGFSVSRFRSLLKVLEIIGLPLREALPESEQAVVRLHDSYGERVVQERLKVGLRVLLANRLNRGKRCCEEDHRIEMYGLGDDIGNDGLTKQERDSETLGSDELYWLRRYSDKGDDRASYLCGRLYLEGAGVQQNDLLAERYFKRCEQTSRDAQYWLGVLYSEARSEVCDIAKACGLLRKAYEAGSVDAIHRLGDLSLQYAVVQAAPSKFVQAYRGWNSVEVESALSLRLGCDRIIGEEGAFSNAAAWYRIGMEKSDADSTFKYGICLVQGLGCSCDADEGLAYIEKASSMGCADAAVYIAMRHWCLPDNTKGERDEALRHLRYAKALGDRRARILLEQMEQCSDRPRILDDDDDSLLLRWPIGVCNSGIHSCDMLRKDAKVLLKSADQGVSVSMFKAGCKLYNGFTGQDDYGCEYVEVEADSAKARTLFERAAILGYVPAITMLGVITEKEMGFDRGRAIAYRYYLIASRMGDGYASWRLYKQRTEEIASGGVAFDALAKDLSPLGLWSSGYCYENGFLVARDYAKAVQFYERAASSGFTPAMVSWGRALVAGWIGDGSLARAYALFYEAACRGDIGGIYFLGKCYELGWGCEIDIGTAYMLYVESARHGNASAKLGAAKIALNHKGELPEYGDYGYVRNAVVAESVILPYLYFSILSPRYKRFDCEKVLRELAAMGNAEAAALIAGVTVK